MLLPKKNKKTGPKTGVVGWPISHSLSPHLHGFWLDRYGIAATYEAFAVRPEDLGAFVENLPEQNIIGFNLTVPHKEMILPFLDEMEAEAQKIGAVNVVSVQKGRLYGYNTDGYGFFTNLTAHAPDWVAKSGPVAVIGAGGAARAALVRLLDAGVPEIRLINRTKTRAEALAKSLAGYYNRQRITVCDWAARGKALESCSLLVNSSSLGMIGQPELDIDFSVLPTTAVVYDIVYNPLETALLEQARRRGNPVVDGLGMLLYQAAPAFTRWFGQKVCVDTALRQHILRYLQE